MQSLKKTFTNGLIVLGLLFGVMVSATADDLFDSDMILAQEGNPIGQFNIGYSYDSGKGVRQDYAKAKEWAGKSCDNGNQAGCDNYRILNEQGH